MVLLGAIVAFVRRDAGHLAARVRWAILVLALLGGLLLIGIVLSPKLIRTWLDPRKPLCTVLVDGSRSMLLTDTYSGPSAEWIRKRAEGEAGGQRGEGTEGSRGEGRGTREKQDPRALDPRTSGLAPSSSPGLVPPASGLPPSPARLGLVRRLLGSRAGEGASSGWLTKLDARFDLVGWRFAGRVEALPLGKDAPPFEVDPDGHTTALGEALDEAVRLSSEYGSAGASPSHGASPSQSGERRPRALVLLSDGAWNTGRDPTEVARMLGRVGIPIYVVGLGNPNPPRDTAVLSVRAPQTALPGDEVLLTAEVMATGMSAVRLPVQLVSGADVLGEKSIVAPPTGRPVTVTFSFTPEGPGRRKLSVRVPKQEGEQDESNNVASATVDVAERKIRVLLADDEPRWEFRFLRNVFERDPAVALTVCLLRPKVGPIKGEGYLAELPTQKRDFSELDVVILGDIARERLPGDFLKETADFVRLRGGALVAIAGRRQVGRNLVDTPIASILPVTLEAGAGAEGRGEPFHVELSQEGASHLVTRLSADPEENEALWSRLPKLHWSAGVAGLARGATALLVHPYRLAGASKLPLLAAQQVGTGKVLWLGVEETWRWREQVGDQYHYRFWAQAVRWLTRKQFAEGDPRARLSLDRAECDVGESVEIEAHCVGPDGFPLEGGRVALKIDFQEGRGTGDEGRRESVKESERESVKEKAPDSEAPSRSRAPTMRLAMTPAPGGWGIYRATFKPTRPGQFTIRPIVPVYGAEPLPSAATVTVTRADLEMRFLAQDANTLSAIAQASGGRYLSVDESDQLPTLLAAKIERRVLTAEYSPCRHWAYYSSLAALLALAWLIRKRSGLA